MKIETLFIAVSLVIFTGCVTHKTHEESTVEERPSIPDSLTSPGGKFALLPSAVQHTVLAYGGSSEIRDIYKANTEKDVYVVQFMDSLTNPTLFISEDGTPAYTLTPFLPFSVQRLSMMLPPAVKSTLQKQAPNAVILSVQPGPLMSYKISFADTQSRSLLILEDGTVLQTQEKPLKESSLH